MTCVATTFDVRYQNEATWVPAAIWMHGPPLVASIANGAGPEICMLAVPE